MIPGLGSVGADCVPDFKHVGPDGSQSWDHLCNGLKSSCAEQLSVQSQHDRCLWSEWITNQRDGECERISHEPSHNARSPLLSGYGVRFRSPADCYGGYLGSVSHNLFFHQSPNAVPAALGYTLNPQVGGGDLWDVSGHANYNAMLAELKHQFSRDFMADAQF